MNTIYLATLAFLAALFVSLQTTLVSGLSMTIAVAVTLAALVSALLAQSRVLRQLLVAVFFCFLGISSGLRLGPSAEAVLEPYFGREVLVECWVEPASIKNMAKGVSSLVQVERVQCDGQAFAYSGRLRTTLPNTEGLSGRLVLRGRLTRLTSLRNPGGFDSALYNRINDIGGRLQQVQLAGQQSGSQLQAFRQQLGWYNLQLRAAFKRHLGERDGTLVGSMLFGGSSNIDEATRDIFTANGLSHLLSVSGTHLVLLAGFLSLLLRFLPLPKSWRRLLLTLGLCAYAALCGLRAPILRALLMSMVLLWGRVDAELQQNGAICGKATECVAVRGRSGHAERGTLLCLTAVLLLIYKPLWLLDTGFLLSFAAAAGLIWLLPACRRLLPQCLPELLGEGLSITMAAQLAAVPLLVSSFHQLALVSLLSNILLVPVLELMVLLASCAAVIMLVPVELGQLLGGKLLQLVNFFLEQLLVQGELLAELPFSNIVIGSLLAWCVVLYYALLLLWADCAPVQLLRNSERRAAMLALSLLLCATFLWQRCAQGPLTCYFLDVGQGDSVVLHTPDRRIVVYDTGGLSGLDTGRRVVAPFVRSLGSAEVEVLILSHYDFDHAGGAAGLLQAIQVRRLLLPKELLTAENLPLYEAIVRTALQRGTQIAFAEGAVDVGNDCRLDLHNAYAEAQQGNEASTIARITSSCGSILLTGDLSAEGEQELAAEPATVFKAAHHGSRYSNSEELLQNIRPKLTVISCGAGNSYGHPHQETLERLQSVGSRILRTDVQGCIKIELGERLKCYSYNNHTRNFQQLQFCW